jgi:transposase-like protein
MARKHFKPEQIISKLREVEVLLSQGQTQEQAIRAIGVTGNTFYRWRKEYGGMGLDQAKRLKDLEVENNRLKKAVAELTIDNQILKEVSKGKF